FIVGILLIFTGQALRATCFRTLGKFFTFEVTIRPNHVLVDSGPYGIVRHPGYTASVIRLAGAALLGVGPRTYVWMCGIAESNIVTFALTTWLFCVFYTQYSLLSRGPVEDDMLRKRFGKEWQEYAKRVPYRYIPGVV
ncbi:hypothetical protein M422DRAFT_160015, partial [Sphaerobolus stellatus SS14]